MVQTSKLRNTVIAVDMVSVCNMVQGFLHLKSTQFRVEGLGVITPKFKTLNPKP